MPDRRDVLQPTRLRQQAEDFLRKTDQDIGAMPVQDVQQLVHELQVSQIELEMQNEELRRTQQELEASRDRYSALYDFAPVGYLTLDRAAVILEANLTAARLLGTARGALLRQRLTDFIVPADQDTFYRHRQQVVATHLLQAGANSRCSVRTGQRSLSDLKASTSRRWLGSRCDGARL